MNSYEILLSEASENGLVVKEKPLKYNNGRIKGSRVAIRQDLSTSVEKACVLAEELGHHYTTYGNILDQSDASNRKQELRARAWAYNKQIGLLGLIRAYEHGCRNRFEIAEYLVFYRNKYGKRTNVDNYVVYFIPNLVIMKRI